MQMFRSQDLQRQASLIQEAAMKEPVVITYHDRPRFVLMTMQEYDRLRGRRGQVGAMTQPSSFEKDGFLSPEIDRFRLYVRSHEPSKKWFELADDINRLALELLQRHQAPSADPQRFTFSGLFVRAHQSFQAALILIERGMIGDARAVLRSATESAIALHAVANDAQFVDRIVGDEYYTRRKMVNLTLGTPEYRDLCSAEEIREMDASIADIDRMKADPNAKIKIEGIKWEQVARTPCPDLYFFLYRSLSWDGTHVTANSLTRYFNYDANSRATSFKVAPEVADVPEGLLFACNAMIWALNPYELLFPTDGLALKLQNLMARFKALSLPDAPGSAKGTDEQPIEAPP